MDHEEGDLEILLMGGFCYKGGGFVWDPASFAVYQFDLEPVSSFFDESKFCSFMERVFEVGLVGDAIALSGNDAGWGDYAGFAG